MVLTEECRKLVEDNIGLVYSATKITVEKYGEYTIKRDEILSLAQFSICKAAQLFIPEKGYKFSTFFMCVFRTELFMEFRKARSGNGRLNGNCSSLNAPMRNTEQLELMEVVEAPDSDGPEAKILRFDEVSTLRKAIEDCLPDRLRRIIYMRYWKCMQQQEIADEMKLSQSCVSRLIKQAREMLADEMRIQGYGA